MDIHGHLQENCNRLLESYHSNLQDVERLQETLINDILPSVRDELQLTPDATEWAREWLLDTGMLHLLRRITGLRFLDPSGTMFRIARRNKFTKSFTLEAVRKNLVWRLQNLWEDTSSPVPMPNVHCLPSEVVDPFGRPIVVIETIPVTFDAGLVKRGILQFFESLRSYLAERFRNPLPSIDSSPPLQCIVLVDLRALTYQRAIHPKALDVVSWAMRELIPRYPGMLAGVFMLNYSWAHSSVWAIVKRVLPETALSRVFFPSQKELIDYFSRDRLPQEYGGNMGSLPSLHDPLQMLMASGVLSAPSELVHASSMSSEAVPDEQPPPLPSTSTSLLNPFFGYPVSSTSGHQLPLLRHGRRRKRDLLRTLAMLFWTRWHSHIIFTCCLSAACIVLRRRLRPFLYGLLQALKHVREAIQR
ncbi:CRAL-TRIO domain-containing protein [Coprinopsis sp. MPI-PUGE-AT-0042]|nr:CRAL-TRIO domain-containing protein [Coprinopsis sp. MPI-PUGE-AT-0042]